MESRRYILVMRAHEEGWLAIEAPYSERLLDRLHLLSTRRYDEKTKHWLVPRSELAALKRVFSDWQILDRSGTEGQIPGAELPQGPTPGRLGLPIASIFEAGSSKSDGASRKPPPPPPSPAPPPQRPSGPPVCGSRKEETQPPPTSLHTVPPDAKVSSRPATPEPNPLPAGDERRIEETMRARKYSPKTIKRYLAVIRDFSRFTRRSPRVASQSDITRYLSDLEKHRGVAASTLNQAISAIKFCLEAVYGHEAIATRRPKADRRLPGVLSKEEALLICQAPKNLKHRVALALAYSAGLRVSEIVRLRVADIDPSRGVLHIRAAKGRKDRYTILAKGVALMISEYREIYQPKEWLIEGAEGAQISIRSLQEVFYKACREAGVDKDVSIHCLRHSFATHLLEEGTDIRYIQTLLGHSSPKTTQVYTHVARRDVLRIKSPFDSS